MIPEDRNSTSKRNYTWSYTNDTVDVAVYPLSDRTPFPDVTEETCIYWRRWGNGGNPRLDLMEERCGIGQIEGANTNVLCEAVHDKPLSFNDIPPF